MKHLIEPTDLTRAEISEIIALADRIIEHPEELERFAGTGGGTGRNRGAGDDSGLQRNFNFNGRVTAGIENLTAEN